MTPAQQSLLDAITEVLQADTRIESAWLHGSLARDAGDEWSDIDVIAICAPGAAEDAIRRYVSESRRHRAHGFRQRALWPGVERRHKGLATLTTSCSASGISSAGFPPCSTGNSSTRPAPPRRKIRPPPPAPPRPARVKNAIDEFLRILGLLPIVIGREEYVNALSGITHLRTQTINLMAEENGIEPWDRGGALHVNRLITPEQRAELESLGPIEATRELDHRGPSRLCAPLPAPRPRRRRKARRALAQDVRGRHPRPSRTDPRRDVLGPNPAAIRRHIRCNELATARFYAWQGAGGVPFLS